MCVNRIEVWYTLSIFKAVSALILLSFLLYIVSTTAIRSLPTFMLTIVAPIFYHIKIVATLRTTYRGLTFAFPSFLLKAISALINVSLMISMISMITVLIITKRLKEGKTYEDFQKA